MKTVGFALGSQTLCAADLFSPCAIVYTLVGCSSQELKEIYKILHLFGFVRFSNLLTMSAVIKVENLSKLCYLGVWAFDKGKRLKTFAFFIYKRFKVQISIMLNKAITGPNNPNISIQVVSDL